MGMSLAQATARESLHGLKSQTLGICLAASHTSDQLPLASGAHSSTSAPHCLQEDQSKKGAGTHLCNKPCISTEGLGASEEVLRPPLVFH